MLTALPHFSSRLITGSKVQCEELLHLNQTWVSQMQLLLDSLRQNMYQLIPTRIINKKQQINNYLQICTKDSRRPRSSY